MLAAYLPYSMGAGGAFSGSRATALSRKPFLEAVVLAEFLLAFVITRGP